MSSSWIKRPLERDDHSAMPRTKSHKLTPPSFLSGFWSIPYLSPSYRTPRASPPPASSTGLTSVNQQPTTARLQGDKLFVNRNKPLSQIPRHGVPVNEKGLSRVLPGIGSFGAGTSNRYNRQMSWMTPLILSDATARSPTLTSPIIIGHQVRNIVFKRSRFNFRNLLTSGAGTRSRAGQQPRCRPGHWSKPPVPIEHHLRAIEYPFSPEPLTISATANSRLYGKALLTA